MVIISDFLKWCSQYLPGDLDDAASSPSVVQDEIQAPPPVNVQPLGFREALRGVMV